MGAIVKKLSTAWLILALIVAPLQATAAPVAPESASHPCPMAAASAPDTHAVHSQDIQHHSGHTKAPCADCQDHACGDGQCDDNSCCVFHLSLSLLSLPTIALPDPAGTPGPDGTASLVSRPPSPHFRPPV